jgi:hypothetical protein
MALTIDFPFDELPVMVCDVYDASLLAYGHAELTDAGQGYEGEFYVSAIKLDSGARLTGGRLDSFEGQLFKRIADEIQNDRSKIGRAAAEAWAEAFEQSHEPDPDYERDRRRDDAAYFAHA